MDGTSRPRRGSYVFGIVLIALGVLFLASNLIPRFDAWQWIWRYWPLLLIVLGIAKLWDHVRTRQNSGANSGGFVSGVLIAVVIIVVLFAISLRHSGRANPILHYTRDVDAQGAQAVTANINMGAGQLTIHGGASHLLDASFNYDQDSGQPTVNYVNSGTNGRLDISQPSSAGPHFGRNENDWDLSFGTVPMDMQIELGAGQTDLNLKGIELTHLRVNMGAGQLDLDLTGDRKQNLEANIQGGVGQATIHLPRNVGVEVRADGGIGSIDTVGLHRQGDEYVNDAFGKSAVTIHMNVEGGVGEIRLVEEQ